MLRLAKLAEVSLLQEGVRLVDGPDGACRRDRDGAAGVLRRGVGPAGAPKGVGQLCDAVALRDESVNEARLAVAEPGSFVVHSFTPTEAAVDAATAWPALNGGR